MELKESIITQQEQGIRLYELLRDDPRLRRGEESRLRRVPEELMIARLMSDGPPAAMYDLGVGCFNEFRTLKIVWPGMRLFGCEPDVAEREAARPLFDGVLLGAAVGREDGTQKLYYEAEAGKGGSTIKPQLMEDRLTSDVQVMSLDSFDRLCGQPDRILLWMDIEGSELDAIAGGHQLLSGGRVRWINVETRDAPHAGHPTTAQVTAALDPYGFRPVHRYNVQGAYPEAAGDVIYMRKGVAPLLEHQCNWGVQV